MRETVIRDPVAAYDLIAASYDQIAARRGAYRDGFARNRGVLSRALGWNTIRSSREARASLRAACRR